MTDDMLSWLRREVEAEKAAAEALDGKAWTVADDGDDFAYLDIEGGGRTANSCGCCGVGTLDKAEAVHIALHDPRDTIARCEAELALLDELLPELESAEEVIRAEWNAGPDLSGALIRALLAAYRHRPGYLPEWDPEGTTP